MTKRLVVVLTALSAFSGVAVSIAEEPTSMLIRGETHQIWPIEDLVKRGFDVPQIPRDLNAAWIYIRAMNAYKDLPPEDGPALDYATGKAWPVGDDSFEAYMTDPNTVDALRLFREASQLKRCQMPYFGDPSSSVVAVLLPNLSPMRFLGKIAVAEGRRLEAKGEYARAFEQYLIVMRAGGHAAEGATLIEGLVGLAIWGLADRAMDDLILRHPIPVKELQRWDKQLDLQAPKPPSPRRGLEGERAFGPAVVDEFTSRPLQAFRNIGFLQQTAYCCPDIDLGGDDGWSALEARLGRLFLPDRTIKKHMAGFYDLALAQMEPGSTTGAVAEDLEETYIREKIPQWDVLSRALLPSLSRVTLLGERARVEMALTRTILALAIFAQRHDGDYPPSLAELGEDFVSKHAQDPFSDSALGYMPTEEGYVLYSVGPNGFDDGGKRGERWEELDMSITCPPDPIEPFEASGGDQ